jgi:prepilin-type N-terminal cleavage/methylation domain-containing protein
MRTKRGWTLIELLVVIAIIVVLAGITYAVVAYAREKSSQARCISNLRQIGVALKLYTEDYKQADWDTEITGVDCERIDMATAERLSDRWGFPPTLPHLVSAGYLKGGNDVLKCRSCWVESVLTRPYHYSYNRPYLVMKSSNPPFEINEVCELQRRMYEYPIVLDIFHWRPGRGGVALVLRLNDRVETKPLHPTVPFLRSIDL